MNHQKIYSSIIEKAKLEPRKKRKRNSKEGAYYEQHHITPKCLGGTNDKDNLVLLTAREHFIVHKLLTYIHPTNRKISSAFHRMAFSKNLKYEATSRDFEYARELIHYGKNNGMYGKHHTPEAIARIKFVNSGERNGLRKHVILDPNFIKGKNNHASKRFEIEKPDGTNIIIKGLRQFCEENKLHHTNMLKVANGMQKNHKGYKCKRLD